MGLDMTLYAERHRGYKYDEDSTKHETAFMGCKLVKSKYEIEYWRKHNQLHGHIVQEYAYEGVDDCKPVWLTRENLEELKEYLGSVQNLPATEGFFFGSDSSEYSPDERKFDVDAMQRAIDFLDAQEDPKNKVDRVGFNDQSVKIHEYTHAVYYHASW